MKIILIIALLIGAKWHAEAAQRDAADLVLTNPVSGVTVHLRQTSCTVETVLAAMKPEHVERFRDGLATGPRGKLRFCWTDIQVDGTRTTDGSVYLWDEDGDNGWTALEGFRQTGV